MWPPPREVPREVEAKCPKCPSAFQAVVAEYVDKDRFIRAVTDFNEHDKEYQVLKCCGCKHLHFRLREPDERHRKMISRAFVQEQEQEQEQEQNVFGYSVKAELLAPNLVMDDRVKAITQEAVVLTEHGAKTPIALATALRSIVEAVCKQFNCKGKDKRNLLIDQINDLPRAVANDPNLTEAAKLCLAPHHLTDLCKALHIVREHGNEAVHMDAKFDPEQLKTTCLTVGRLLGLAFFLPARFEKDIADMLGPSAAASSSTSSSTSTVAPSMSSLTTAPTLSSSTGALTSSTSSVASVSIIAPTSTGAAAQTVSPPAFVASPSPVS